MIAKTVPKPVVLLVAVFLIAVAIFGLKNPFEFSQPLEITEKGAKAPEFQGIANWINSQPLKMEDLRGKVVLIDFWTFTCINCIRTLPYLKDWDEKYRDRGLVIIGIHSPEFNFEKDYANVKSAVENHGIKYPVAMDNDFRTWRAYQNHFWPHKYLVDKDGFIRYDHIGEGAYAETEGWIKKLLEEAGQNLSGIQTTTEKEVAGRLYQTPELYGGYEYARQPLGNSENFQPDVVHNYSITGEIIQDKIYLEGAWIANPENLQSAGQSKMVLKFTASELNIVAGSPAEIKLQILVDGHEANEVQEGKDVIREGGKSFALVKEKRLYNLISKDNTYGQYLIEIIPEQPGFQLFSFTFGQ